MGGGDGDLTKFVLKKRITDYVFPTPILWAENNKTPAKHRDISAKNVTHQPYQLRYQVTQIVK